MSNSTRFALCHLLFFMVGITALAMALETKSWLWGWAAVGCAYMFFIGFSNA